jgi:hypothetical protein
MSSRLASTIWTSIIHGKPKSDLDLNQASLFSVTGLLGPSSGSSRLSFWDYESVCRNQTAQRRDMYPMLHRTISAIKVT